MHNDDALPVAVYDEVERRTDHVYAALTRYLWDAHRVRVPDGGANAQAMYDALLDLIGQRDEKHLAEELCR